MLHPAPASQVAPPAALPTPFPPVPRAPVPLDPAALVPGDGPGPLRLSHRRLRSVIRHVHDNIDGRITLRDLADAANLSPFHFARCFRRQTGMSPLRYVCAARVAHACRLLAGTGEGLAVVAVQAGFASQSHFTTAFARLVGTTPGRWRDAARRGGDALGQAERAAGTILRNAADTPARAAFSRA